jgi:small subunit ribosomal protein S2
MATNAEVKDLLEAGVHFGHLTRKWNPNMAPYIYMERNGIHVINLYKTVAKLDEACEALKKISASGRKVLFVATKKQAKDIVAEKVSAVNMPYITERWPGGMLTNFVTIRKAVKKMTSIDRMKKDGTFDTLSKKERLQVERLRAKLEKNLGSISDMTRLPGAIFVVMVDTNSDPRPIDFVIPSNDDASKSIEIIMSKVTDAVAEGLAERRSEKASEKDENEAEATAVNAPEAEAETPAKEVSKTEEPIVEVVKEEPAKPEATKEEVPEKEEAIVKEAEKAESDDLTKIEGIGPKAAEALVNAGLNTYEALAGGDPEKIKELLTEASSRLAHLDPASWPKQAKMAAEGLWDDLKEWQEKVKGGVE